MEEKTYKMSTARLLLYILFASFFIPFFGIGIVFIFFIIVGYLRLYLTITQRGIFMRAGIINVRTIEIPFDKVNTLSVKRGLLGNMFGYGDIQFLTGNDVIATFPGVSNPEALRDEIMKLVNDKTAKPLQVENQPSNSYDSLNELASLKEKGIITEQEFETKKKQILGI